MINGGLEHLDPHSMYINPHEFKQFDKHSEGKFGGVGIQVNIDPRTSRLTVISPIAGTPAYEAGILAGDIILKVDGKAIDEMRLADAVDLIQGDPGAKVVLTVLHEGGKEPVDISITRAIIRIKSVLGDTRKPGHPDAWEFMYDKKAKIGYLRLTGFSKTAPEEMRKVLEGLESQGVRGVIVDVRNNPGGLLQAAVEIADLFLDSGRIVSTNGRYYRKEEYDAHAKGTLLEGVPVVVLINRYSASASEILAAALKDHDRATLIGERTYGKGSVQNIIMLENGAALKLTTASYRRPNGKNIHRFPDSKEEDEWGVLPSPGFEVKLTLEERREYLIDRSERDVIHDKPETKAEGKGEKKKPFVDQVLQKALEHLRKEIADKRSAA
jgi:carboxyl-terminal processing protease